MVRSVLFGAVAILSLASCSTLQSLILAPTNIETVTALREVLNSSSFRAIAKLALLKQNGFEEILPEEVEPVVGVLRTLGLGSQIDKVNQGIVDASSIALEETKGTVTDAISRLTFADAVAVVQGGPDAATVIFKNAMYEAVQDRYSSKIDTELQKIDEMKYWDTAVKSYNLFAKNKVEDSLADLLAKKAVDALFLTMAKEEAEIRKDPASLGIPVVTRVFDYYRNQPK